MWTTKASLTDYGEEKENASIRKLEMLMCGSISGKNCTVWPEETFIVVEVEHVKAHRTKTDKKHMSHFHRFVTEGNE